MYVHRRVDPSEQFRERRQRARRRKRLRRAGLAAALAGVAAGVVLGASFFTRDATGESPVTMKQATAVAKRNPPIPNEIRGVHLTMGLASIEGMLGQYLALRAYGLNTLELDVKDENGTVGFSSKALPQLAHDIGAASLNYDGRVAASAAEEAGVYLIGRVVAFADPTLGPARSRLALQWPDGTVWRDPAGLAWLNPYDKRVWRYIVDVAAAAANAGFDEIQFDYVRFPSDGDLDSIVYPMTRRESKMRTIERFLAYASKRLRPLGVRVSADLFGLAATRDRAGDLSIYGYVLKSSGTIQTAGWVFVVFCVLWIGLNVHSGWVRYHERAGSIAFQNLQVPDELALAGLNPASWLSNSDKKNVASGQAHYYSAMKAGMFTNKEALSKLAWLDYLAGDTEQALGLLASAAANQTGEGKALSLYYRGAILNRLARYPEAKADLTKALEERPDLRVAREELGESLWQTGQRQPAIDMWTKAVEDDPDLALANYQLAGAAAIVGDSEAAADYEKQGREHTPDDPYFHWMIGLRLQNIGMNSLAEKHFQRAIELDQSFIMRRDRRPSRQQ